MSTSPGITNLPRPSISVAPGGAAIEAASPTVRILSPSMTTVAFSRGGRPVPSMTVAPDRTIVWITFKPGTLSLLLVYEAGRDLYQQSYPQPCITLEHYWSRLTSRIDQCRTEATLPTTRSTDCDSFCFTGAMRGNLTTNSLP